MLLEHRLQFRVRYKETDAMGVMHHANYLPYFEVGRTELLRANGINYRDLESSGLFMVVVRLNCRYHRPARYDDVLELHTRTTRITAAKIEHEYQLFREQELLCTADTTLACVDRDGTLQRVPDWLREHAPPDAPAVRRRAGR